MKMFFAEWLRKSIKLILPFIVLLLLVILLPVFVFSWSIGGGFITLIITILIYGGFLDTYMDFWRKW